MPLSDLTPNIILVCAIAYALSIVICIYFMQNGFKKLDPTDELHKKIIKARWITYTIAFTPPFSIIYALVAMVAFVIGFVKRNNQN